MEKKDLIEGLKRAMERGYSLDIVVSSFINAGYNKQDVLDSAKTLSGSVLTPDVKPSVIQQKPVQTLTSSVPPILKPMSNQQVMQGNQSQQRPPQTPPPSQPTNPQNQVIPKKSHTGLIIFLAILLVVLLGALVVVFLAKDKILEFLGNLVG